MPRTIPVMMKNGQRASLVARTLADQISDHICGLGEVDNCLLQQFIAWLSQFTRAGKINIRSKSALAFQHVVKETTQRQVTTSDEIHNEAVLMVEKFDVLLKDLNGSERLPDRFLYTLIHTCIVFSQALGEYDPSYRKII